NRVAAPARPRPAIATVADGAVLDRTVAQRSRGTRSPIRGNRRTILHGAGRSAGDPGAGRARDRVQNLSALHLIDSLLDRRRSAFAEVVAASHRAGRAADPGAQRGGAPGGSDQ